MQKTGYRSFHETAKVRFQDAHFKGQCRSRLTLTFHPGYEFGLPAWPLNFDLQLNYWTVGFMTRHKSYFQVAKMQKTATGRFTKRQMYVSRTPISKDCFVRVWPWPLTFHPGHEFGLCAWHLKFDLELKLLDSGVYDSS